MSILDPIKNLYTNPYKLLKKDNNIRAQLLTESEALYLSDILDRSAKNYCHCYDYEVTRKQLLDDCFKARTGQGELWGGDPSQKLLYKDKLISSMRPTSFRSIMLYGGLTWMSTLFFLITFRLTRYSIDVYTFLSFASFFVIFLIFSLVDSILSKLYFKKPQAHAIRILINVIFVVLAALFAFGVQLLFNSQLKTSTHTWEPLTFAVLILLYIVCFIFVMWQNKRYAEALAAEKPCAN